jgi:hypothetical protein
MRMMRLYRGRARRSKGKGGGGQAQGGSGFFEGEGGRKDRPPTWNAGTLILATDAEVGRSGVPGRSHRCGYLFLLLAGGMRASAHRRGALHSRPLSAVLYVCFWRADVRVGRIVLGSRWGTEHRRWEPHGAPVPAICRGAYGHLHEQRPPFEFALSVSSTPGERDLECERRESGSGVAGGHRCRSGPARDRELGLRRGWACVARTHACAPVCLGAAGAARHSTCWQLDGPRSSVVRGDARMRDI